MNFLSYEFPDLLKIWASPRYDPLKAPDPEDWLALDEQERIELARDYRRRKSSAHCASFMYAAARFTMSGAVA
jgi:hypothetical protein